MAITIRERPEQVGTLESPLPVTVNLSLIDPPPIAYTIRLGYDGRLPSQVLGFQLSRRAEFSLELRSPDRDPFIVHAHASLTEVDDRTYMAPPTDGRWLVMEPGQWRLIIGITMEVMLDLEAVITLRPVRVPLLGGVDCIDCGTSGLLGFGVPAPVVDNRTIERWSALDYSLEIPHAPGDVFAIPFTGATGVLQIWNEDEDELLLELPLDAAALAGHELVAYGRAWLTGTWPDVLHARALVSLPGRSPIRVMEGEWLVEEGVPMRLAGRPALDDLVLQRHEDHTYRLDLYRLLVGATASLSGWIGDCEVWNGDPAYTVRWGAAAANGADVADGEMTFTFPSSVTTTWPDQLEMRAWLTDPDGGTHWIARGDWTISQGYSRYEENVVRDDRIIQRREDFLYEATLIQGASPMNLTGATGSLRLSQLNGASLGTAADQPLPLDPARLASGVASAVVPYTITRLLPNQVAMRVFLNLADGRTGILALAGLWTVSEGYTDTGAIEVV